MTESEIQREILTALHKLGMLAWRINSGRVRTSTGMVQLAPGGHPDIAGVLPGGRALYIEVKRPTRHGPAPLREDQERFIKRLMSVGAMVIVATCVDDVLRALVEMELAS